MTPPATSTPSPGALRRSRRPTERRNAHRSAVRSRPDAASPPDAPESEPSDLSRQGRPLDSYTTPHGALRELVVEEGAGGSLLVVDRDGITLCDRRLVAHIAADEPNENVAIVCGHYLGDETGRFCRPVGSEDLQTIPFGASQPANANDNATDARDAPAHDLVDCPDSELDVIEAMGCLYRLGVVSLPRSRGRQLRWSRRASHDAEAEWEPASLREVIGALESYEPPLTLTATALASHVDCNAVSPSRLRSEYERMCASRVVLNRGLREAVLQATSAHGVTFSEIARRCGKVKLDKRGRSCGETSWLARRIGLMAESGRPAGTPWVRSDVLALIARRGLGISPREVEL